MVPSNRYHHHRYRHYNPHYTSPHHGILNLLIGLATLICLWNVWTAPPSPPSTTTSSPMVYGGGYGDTTVAVHGSQTSSPNNVQQQQDPLPRYSSSSTVTTTDPVVSATEPSEKHTVVMQHDPRLFLPVHTAENGQRFVLLTNYNTLQDNHNKNLDAPLFTEDGIQEKHAKLSHQQSNTHSRQQHLAVLQHQRPQRRLRNNQHNDGEKNALMAKQRVTSKPRGFASPLFVVETQPSSAGASLTTSTATASVRVRPRWSTWMYAIAITGSILAGGLYAKRVLDRIDRWEHLSKEDSLAYDLAYTSPYNNNNDDVISHYGSFVSDWSGDYLDRFDV